VLLDTNPNIGDYIPFIHLAYSRCTSLYDLFTSRLVDINGGEDSPDTIPMHMKVSSYSDEANDWHSHLGQQFLAHVAVAVNNVCHCFLQGRAITLTDLTRTQVTNVGPDDAPNDALIT
jgi:hypothetical protein